MERREDARGVGVVVAALVILVLARAVTSVVPSMWGWGINVQRFLPTTVAWLPWALTALFLMPALGEAFGRVLTRLGDHLVDGRWSSWLAGLAGAAIVWSYPDRTWITGDFLIRQGSAEFGAFPTSFIQSLPIEVIVNKWVPRLFEISSQMDPSISTRAIGAAAAGGLAVVAVRLSRAWGLTGAAAIIAATVIFFGGYLTVFTGLGKPAALMCLLTATVVLGCERFVRPEGGGVLLGISLAVAFWTHRGALLLAPVWIVAILMARGTRSPLDRGFRWDFWLALLLPLFAGIAVAPLVWRIARTWDLPSHIAPPAVRSAGIWGSAFAPLHLLDLVNVLMFYAPTAVVALALSLSGAYGGRRRVTGTNLMWPLVVPLVPLLLFVHPQQGIFRDLDVFAPTGVAFAILSAHAIGSAIQRKVLPVWLAAALLTAAAAPALQWLAHFHDPAEGMRRVHSYVVESPARPADERAHLWDGIAYRAFRLRQWDQAAEASAQSVRYAPHPRALIMWAIARTYTGDYRGAESLYVALTMRTPDDPLVWIGLGGAALRTGDSAQVSRARAVLYAYAPQSREARLIRRHLRVFPDVWPTASEGRP